jgi:ribosomal protein L29
MSRLDVEAGVLDALQTKLLRKDFFEEFCREFAKELNRLRMEQRAGQSSATRERERVKRDIQRVIEAIKQGSTFTNGSQKWTRFNHARKLC